VSSAPSAGGSLASSGAATHVLVSDVASPTLAPETRHHLERVLRLRPATVISVGDGRGAWRLVRLGADLEPVTTIVQEPSPLAETTVACALAKSDKPDLVVQKLTELGVDHIVFFASKRSVVRWEGDRVERHLERLRRVVEAAVEQCRRPFSPSVSHVAEVGLLLDRTGVVRADLSGGRLTAEHRVVLVGPEGGWDPLDGVDAVPCVGFGPNVLRAETAAIAAGTHLVATHLFS
jgi:16S rRNA (uracil1498-N3)-methyltransferase